MEVWAFLIIAGIYLLLELVMFKNKISVYLVLCIMTAVILTVTQVFTGQVTVQDWINTVQSGPTAMATGTILFAMYGMFGGTLKVFGVIDDFVRWAVSLAKSKGTTLIVVALIIASMIAVLGGGGFAIMSLAVPLLLALGFSKKHASVFTVQTNCITYFLTVGIYALITPVTGLGMQDLTKMSLICTVCILITSIAYVAYIMKKYKPQIDQEQVEKLLSEGDAPKFKVTYLLPVVPVILIWILGLNAYLSFLISILVALVICAITNKASLSEFSDLVAASLTTGICDVSGLLSVNIILGLIVMVMKVEPVAALFESAMGVLIPDSKIGLFLIVEVIMLIGCAYRGIGNLTGLGYGICIALMSLPNLTVMNVAAIMMCLTTMGLLNDPCVAYALYANSYSKCEHSTYFVASFVPAAICSTVCLLCAIFVI